MGQRTFEKLDMFDISQSQRSKVLPKLGTGKSARGASVGRLRKKISLGFSAHEGRPRETPFKSLVLIV